MWNFFKVLETNLCVMNCTGRAHSFCGAVSFPNLFYCYMVIKCTFYLLVRIQLVFPVVVLSYFMLYVLFWSQLFSDMSKKCKPILVQKKLRFWINVVKSSSRKSKDDLAKMIEHSSFYFKNCYSKSPEDWGKGKN